MELFTLSIFLFFEFNFLWLSLYVLNFFSDEKRFPVFHTVHLSNIILRITNRCHFFVIFLYYMSLPYMFRASISPSSGVFPAVATCCHLVHVVLGVCPRASGSFDVVHDSYYIERRRRTRTYAKHHMNQVATSSNGWEYP